MATASASGGSDEVRPLGARKSASASERRDVFSTASGRPLQRSYGPGDISDIEYPDDIGFPGEYPFTRGIHPTGYRGRLWTMRMFAGFGTAEDTNRRLRYLLDEGETGLSIAFDLPTLMGLDADDPSSAGEFGRCGVCVSSLADMEILLSGIPLENVSTSMTINSPAAIIWAMYIVAAEKQGVNRSRLRGTLQNDILKEYTAQNEYIFPPEPAMRLVTDTIEFATHELPEWNPISVSGYHIREAGSTAAQELAFTLADGMEYVRWAVDRGLEVDDFAPRLSFFFFQREIADASFRYQREVDCRERVLVGVNDYRSEEATEVSGLIVDSDGEDRHAERLRRVRAERDEQQAQAHIRRLESGCAGTENLMPYLLEGVRAYCTLGELCGAMRRAFGEYSPSVPA